MTAVKVVDASAVAALVFGEPAGGGIVTWLGDSQLVAPSLLPYELANICLKKKRRHPHLATALDQALARAFQMNIALLDVDHDAAVRLAERHSLSADDASYLWLSHHLTAALVTLDQRLAAAAG